MPFRRVLLAFLVCVTPIEALASDLADLDQVGRRIAQQPCAKPRVVIRLEKNAHDESVMDRFISLKCARAGSELVKPATQVSEQALPLFASIAGSDQRVPPIFRVGATLEPARNRLGVPEVEKPESLTYLLPGEAREERITFIHDGIKIRRIQWSWYLD